MDYNTFAGKVRNSDCSVLKLDIVYNHTDCRCWSAIVNQGKENIIVTYNVNRRNTVLKCSIYFLQPKS